MLRSISVVAFLIALFGFVPANAQSAFTGGASPADSARSQASETVESDVDVPVWDDVGNAVEDHAGDYVGTRDGDNASYEQESVVYRAPPPLRYNRVEGVVVGLRKEPLRVGTGETARIFGQIAYATSLNDVRYTAGLESQLVASGPTGLKVGATYRKQTLSLDRWKTSYLENSLAAISFRHDFFDYHEAEGGAVYAVQTLPLTLRLTGGFRVEEHRSLSVQTNWSIFAGDFRANPGIEEGRMQALFASLTGGHVRDRDDLPTGGAFRLAATVADGVGGDFSFYRYEADGRVFLPLTLDTRLGLRVRGGYATSRAPLQSQFALGGIGSLRSYGQNRFRGTRMLLGNAEYIIDGATIFDDVLDDVFLVGLADAGWVGGPGEQPRLDDVLPSAGFGVGLDERQIRLDVSWPLRDGPEASSGPSVWLRITPNF